MGSMLGLGGDKTIAKYFDGKVVWVTGASGGLGEALCVELCRRARLRGLILSARKASELERVKVACLRHCPALRAEVLPLDLNEVDSLPDIAHQALQVFCGTIDVLINNGGRGFRDVAWETPLDVDRQLMNVNYLSGVALVKGLLPSWLEAGSGHVVQIASVQGFFGLPGRTAYSATKHAAMGFYDSLRAEVGDFGISVTMVAPGYIATKHSENALRGNGGFYPEGHTTKGVLPEVMAPQILLAVARRSPEFTPAALDARVARILRCVCPTLLFKIMRSRARKERAAQNALLKRTGDGGKSQPLMVA